MWKNRLLTRAAYRTTPENSFLDAEEAGYHLRTTAHPVEWSTAAAETAHSSKS
jgi:hypothetical protein